MNFIQARCYARVDISHDALQVIRDLSDNELLELYGQLGVILRMEDRIYSMTHELIIAHPRFRKLAEGEIIPKYVLMVERNPLGKFGVKFIPVEDDSERIKTYSDSSII